MARFKRFGVLLVFNCLCFTHQHIQENFISKIQESTQTKEAEAKSRILYDFQTRVVAYKDLIESRCLLEILNNNEGIIGRSTSAQTNTISKDFLTSNKLSKRQIWSLAGQRITDFCRGFPTYLIKDVTVDSRQIENGNNLNILPLDHTFTKTRRKRSARGRVRGQTQSQYLSFGNSADPGKAEAESSSNGSKAVVTGSNGMGQAQSQSIPYGCEECLGYQDQDLHYESRLHYPGKPRTQFSGGASQYPQGPETQYPARPGSQYTGGVGSQSPEGPDSQYPGGRRTQYPEGSAIQYQGGPGSQYPGAPGKQYPGGPGAQYPEGTGAQFQGALGTKYPEGPGSQYAGGPRIQYPGGPGTQYPGGNGKHYPEGPGSQYPESPGTQYPGGPGTHYPGGPGTQYPGGPGTQYPGGPGTQYPGGPGAQYPGGPATQYPGERGTQYPGGPGKPYPGGPGTQYPGVPGTLYPGERGTQYPGAPGKQYPGGPGTQYPGGPKTQHPGGLGLQYPGGPGSQYPSGPDEQLPGGVPPQLPSGAGASHSKIDSGAGTRYPGKTDMQYPSGAGVQYPWDTRYTGGPGRGETGAPFIGSGGTQPGSARPGVTDSQAYRLTGSKLPGSEAQYPGDGSLTQQIAPKPGEIHYGPVHGEAHDSQNRQGYFSGIFSGKYNLQGIQSGGPYGYGREQHITNGGPYQGYPPSQGNRPTGQNGFVQPHTSPQQQLGDPGIVEPLYSPSGRFSGTFEGNYGSADAGRPWNKHPSSAQQPYGLTPVSVGESARQPTTGDASGYGKYTSDGSSHGETGDQDGKADRDRIPFQYTGIDQQGYGNGYGGEGGQYFVNRNVTDRQGLGTFSNENGQLSGVEAVPTEGGPNYHNGQHTTERPDGQQGLGRPTTTGRQSLGVPSTQDQQGSGVPSYHDGQQGLGRPTTTGGQTLGVPSTQDQHGSGVPSYHDGQQGLGRPITGGQILGVPSTQGQHGSGVPSSHDGQQELGRPTVAGGQTLGVPSTQGQHGGGVPSYHDGQQGLGRPTVAGGQSLGAPSIHGQHASRAPGYYYGQQGLGRSTGTGGQNLGQPSVQGQHGSEGSGYNGGQQGLQYPTATGGQSLSETSYPGGQHGNEGRDYYGRPESLGSPTATGGLGGPSQGGLLGNGGLGSHSGQQSFGENNYQRGVEEHGVPITQRGQGPQNQGFGYEGQPEHYPQGSYGVQEQRIPGTPQEIIQAEPGQHGRNITGQRISNEFPIEGEQGYSQERTDDSDSQVQTSVQQSGNETLASAQASGRFQGGTSASQISGTYSGSGSFSASAGSNDGKRGVQTQIEGGKEGAKSQAQGRGGVALSEAQVVLSSETGDTQSMAQTNGINHGTQTKVQASEKGGMADAQANGPGSTSSQAQIGFTPYEEGGEENQNTPFKGGGTAGAQSGSYSGMTQTQIQGKFRYGIKYVGASQAASGGSQLRNATFPNGPFNPINFTFTSSSGNSQSQRIASAKPQNPPDVQHTDPANTTSTIPTKTTPRTTTVENNTENTDYEEDNYPEYTEEVEPPEEDTEKPATRNLISQSSKTQRQHIVLDPLEDLDATVHQSNGYPEDGVVLQPGEVIPGSPGYQIPLGFRGKVRSIANGHNTYAIGRNSQAQSVKLSPGSGKIIYRNPVYVVGSKTSSLDGQYSYGSGYTYQPAYQPVQYRELKSGKVLPNFVSIAESETGYQDLKTGKKTPDVHYTQSSSCGIFTNTCVFSGGKKLCFPKRKTNPDGSLMGC